MNIGIVCYPTYGGSGVLATELGKALAQKNHKIHFITYAQPIRLDTFSDNIYYHEVRFADYPLFEHAPLETALASKLVDVVKNENLDIIHVHYAIPHASAAFMAQSILSTQNIHIPFITTLHGTDITLVGRDPSYSSVVTFSINQSNGVTAVSEHLKTETQKHFHIRREIVVIPNFVDLNRFKPDCQYDLKNRFAPNGEKLLCHVSNFRKVKRIPDVLKAFELVHLKTNVKLLMVGDGPERNNIELLAREMNIMDKVLFLGKQEKVENILAACDLFILPSETESFGLSALEAMACKVPCITTNAGGLTEVNKHGVTGFVTPIGDIALMAEYILDLLNNESKLIEFKNQALHHAQQFSMENIVPLYVQLYKNIKNNV